MTNLNKQFVPGLRPTPEDKRDFSFGSFFKTPDVKDIPLTDWLVSEPLKIKDQGSTDFCTGYASTSISEMQEAVELSPEYQFAQTKKIEGRFDSWGANLRDACKSVVKVGSVEQEQAPFMGGQRDFIANWTNWPDLDETAKAHRKKSYFKISGPDMFDEIRAALWQFRHEKRAVLTGVMWRPSWLSAPNGIIPKTPEAGGGGHAIAIIGQKMIPGETGVEPYLVIQNSYGTDVGDNGLFYIPREVVNREFKFGAYMFQDLDPEIIKQIMKGDSMESKRFSFNKDEQWKLWKSFAIALGGYAAVKAVQTALQIDFGPFNELAAALGGFLVNGIRLWLQGQGVTPLAGKK